MAGHNIAKMTTATTGTGTMTLGSAVTGFNTFANAGVYDGELLEFVIRDGASTEVSQGIYTASGTTLTRATVISSTNGGSKISLSGTATVAITVSTRNSVGAWAWYEGLNTQNLTNGSTTKLHIESLDYDDYGILTLGTDILTVNSGWDGYYKVCAQVETRTAFTGTNANMTVQLLLGGNTYRAITSGFQRATTAAEHEVITIEVPYMPLYSTDTLEVRVKNNGGTTVTTLLHGIYVTFLGNPF